MSTLKIKDAAGDEKYLSVTGAGTELDPFIPVQDNIERIINEDNFVNEYLVDSGGSNDLAIDGAATPTPFLYNPPEGYKLIAGRIMVYIEGDGNFGSTLFGDITALNAATGCQVLCNGAVIDTWKDNIDLVTTFFDADGRKAFAKDTKSIAGRWTFTRAAGGMHGLDILSANGIAINIRGKLDHAGFIFRAKVQGRLEAL